MVAVLVLLCRTDDRNNNSVPLWPLRLLWPPCVADADIKLIFLPCGFFFFFLIFLA